MRALFSDTDLSATRRRSLLLAAALLAALCALAVSEGSAPAQDLQAELQDTQGKLEHVHESQSAVAAGLAEENKAIDSMIGEVSALRQRQATVEAELAAKQDELDTATAELEKEKRHLEQVRGQLTRALSVLSERLVAIYESGSPDALDAILESSSWSEMAAQTEYLDRVQSYDDAVVGRVKDLRNQVRGTVQRLADARAKIESARDEIAAGERQVAAARAQAEARFAELKEAQAQRRQTMEALESREQALNDNLASISSQMAAEGTPAPAGTPAPLTPGETAGFISESQASAPAGAPDAIKAAISAANAIATTPYIWGGGHGSFESSGYDCSGAVSYALHGGGFLESPLDSTGLETWGEPGPGRWITVYANSGHAWMMIAGLAFDTVGGPGPRWHSSPVDSPEGFIARHPAGY
jgi:peptidoglycan hydrolase CwlO-like protein